MRLSAKERAAKRKFVDAVERLMLDLTPEGVGHVADDVAENGTDGDGGTVEDGTILECLRLIVDEVNRR